VFWPEHCSNSARIGPPLRESKQGLCSLTRYWGVLCCVQKHSCSTGVKSSRLLVIIALSETFKMSRHLYCHDLYLEPCWKAESAGVSVPPWCMVCAFRMRQAAASSSVLYGDRSKAASFGSVSLFTCSFKCWHEVVDGHANCMHAWWFIHPQTAGWMGVSLCDVMEIRDEARKNFRWGLNKSTTTTT
jgi:hypothetical protein